MEPLRLLETMRAEGTAVPLLGRHLERLGASAPAFGFALDLNEARIAVAEALAQAAPTAVRRVRLTLGAGGLDARANPLDGVPFATVWLCPDPLLEAGGPLCIHKTTHRDHYERPFREARRRGADEALLVDAAGQVVEGTRTSVWARIGGRMLTPPLSAGGLPGVARAFLLETLPDAAEAPLTPEDLAAAEALFVSNALRGLMRVGLKEGLKGVRVEGEMQDGAEGHIPPS